MGGAGMLAGRQASLEYSKVLFLDVRLLSFTAMFVHRTRSTAEPSLEMCVCENVCRQCARVNMCDRFAVFYLDQ